MPPAHSAKKAKSSKRQYTTAKALWPLIEYAALQHPGFGTDASALKKCAASAPKFF